MGWANKLIGWTSNNGVEVSSSNALLVTEVPPSLPSYTTAAKTGTIAAAAAGGACVFAMRLSPTAGTTKAFIESFKIKYTTIAAYTTSVVATRSLVLTRGVGAATSGGTGITTATPKDSDYTNSQFNTTNGGDIRIATTGALTVTGITWESNNLGELTLIHVGAAGGYYEHVYEFDARNHPVELNAGQLLGVRVGASAMDAAGTWVLGVEPAWFEGASYT